MSSLFFKGWPQNLPLIIPPDYKVGGGDEHSELRERCLKDRELFTREFFSHYCEFDFSPMHRDIFEAEKEPDKKGSKIIIAAPRGNAKTTHYCTIKIIHAIVYGYKRMIVVTGFSEAEAIAKLVDIRQELLTNEKLIEVYGPQLHPKAGAKRFITFGDTKVVALSRGKQIRGLKYKQHRPDLIICDDIESIETCATPEQRQKTKEWFRKDVMGAQDTQQRCEIVVAATIIDEDSLAANLLTTPGWAAKKYKAIIEWPKRMDLWGEWERIFSDITIPNAERAKAAEEFYKKNQKQMLDGCKVLWPEGEPFIKLMEYKVREGMAALLSEKQNEPHDPERQILDPSRCPQFSVFWPTDPEWPPSAPQEGFALVRHDKNTAVHSKDLRIVAYYDPAMAEKKKSDYAAVVVCAQDLNGAIYVLDVWLKKQPPEKQIQAVFELARKWGFKLYLEENGFQKLLRNVFTDSARLYPDVKLQIDGVTQHSNKQARISTLEPYFSNGWLLLNQALDPEFINQLRLFPTAHDDGPDALEGAVKQLSHPLGKVFTHSKKDKQL